MHDKFSDGKFLLKDRRHGLIEAKSGNVLGKEDDMFFAPHADVMCALTPNSVKERAEEQERSGRATYPHTVLG